MSSDLRRARNIGNADAADQTKPTISNPSDTLFDSDWEEIVIRFDPSRHCFDVRTAGGSESTNAEFRRIAASDGKN